VAADAGGGDQTEVGAVEDEWVDVEAAEDEEAGNQAEDEPAVMRQRAECQLLILKVSITLCCVV